MASPHWWTGHFSSCSSNAKIFTVNSPPQAHLGCLTGYERFLFLAFDCLTRFKTIEPSQSISHSPVCPVDFPWHNVNLLLWWGHFQKTHANFQSSYVIGSGGVSTSANLCLWMSLKYATVLLVMPQCFFLAYVVYLGSAKPNLAIVCLIFNISHGKYPWEKKVYVKQFPNVSFTMQRAFENNNYKAWPKFPLLAEPPVWKEKTKIITCIIFTVVSA